MLAQTRLSERQLAYIAGVVDVMAAMRLREAHSGNQLPWVGISTPNLAMVQWLADRTGVTVTTVTRSYNRDGCALHCPEPHVHIHSQTGRWSISGARATVMLYNLLPYLELQAESAKELLDVGLRCGRKFNTGAKMAALGWEIPEFVRVVQPAHVPKAQLTAVGECG